MATLDEQPHGMPVWVDSMVETTEQREKLMDFYTQLYGWTWEPGEEATGYYSIASSNGKATFALGQGPGGMGALVPYFGTGDIAASAEKATALGGNVFMGPMDVMEVGAMALIADPTGAVHGLWQAKEFKGFGVKYEPNSIGWFDHTSPDPDAASEYYAGLTGHTVMAPDEEMKILAAGEQWFASFSQGEDNTPSKWDPIYIADSLTRVHDVVRNAGGHVDVEEREVPGSKITVFREPVLKTSITVMEAGQAPEADG